MTRLFQVVMSLVFLFGAAPSFAQATRTWVSGVGDDANPCSRTAPCKTFAGAISKTAVNGEINCLDSAGYGAVTITKSITIDCHTEHGGILSLNTNGVIVNGAGVAVTLRGLVINGAGGTTGNGVRILNAAAVNIDDCIIENFAGTGTQGRGVSIETTTAGVRVNVLNSAIYNTNADGIRSQPTAGTVVLSVAGTSIARGGDSGIRLVLSTTATIDHATITNNPNSGAVVLEQTSNTASISNSTLANNAFGIFSGIGGSPTTRLYASVITGNTSQGLQIAGGSVFSYGNNAIRGNAGNETPTAPSLGLQ